MPQIIDALIVELKLDPAQYKKGLTESLTASAKGKEQLVKGSDEIERHTKGVSETFSKLRNQLLGVAVLFTGGLGIKEFVSSIVSTDISLGRLATVTNNTVGTISRFRTAGLLAGGTGESFTNVIKTITMEMARLQTFGASEIMPLFRGMGIEVIDTAGKFKNATQLLSELVDGVHTKKIDPARATLILQSMGADEASIAQILKGPDAYRKLIDAAGQVGDAMERDNTAAKNLNTAWQELVATSSSLGRSMLTNLEPYFTGVMKRAALLLQIHKLGSRGSGEEPSEVWTAGQQPPVAGVGTMKKSDIENYIRAAAAKRGINPEVAIAVAKSEGLNKYVGDRGSSFGPYQLHYGGVASGGMAVGGLGDEFTKATGLNARDPSTVQKQIDFALDHAAKNGWGPWHGWSGSAFAGIGAGASLSAAGPGGGSRTNNSKSEVHVGTIVVNTQATDAPGIARDIKKELENSSFAMHANGGQQ